jgi:photosystem II stability/assembly factor-like uncharacterized protein
MVTMSDIMRHSAVSLVCVLLFAYPALAQAAPPPSKLHHFVRAIAIDPRAPATVYVATDNQGVLKSIDDGKTWTFANTGIRNYLVYDVKTSTGTADRLYAATWGGGVYQSDDGGVSWRELNDGLGNTAAGAMALRTDPVTRREIIELGTSTGPYERRDDATTWRSIADDLRGWNGPQFQSLITTDAALYLGTERGLYTRRIGTRGWMSIPALKGKRIAALAAGSLPGTLYLGTIADGGPFISRDGGATWRAAGVGLEKMWIRAIAPHPTRAETLYVATSGSGVWRSDDGGETWAATNGGLTDLDVRALTVDPVNPLRLFAGTHGAFFRSDDGGATWRRVDGLPFDPIERQITLIEAQSTPMPPPAPLPTPQPLSPPVPPPVFSKCNQCHGWTDPALNQKPTIWRVAATRRDWRTTVARMSEGTTISRDEQDQIAAFLDRYTR